MCIQQYSAENIIIAVHSILHISPHYLLKLFNSQTCCCKNNIYSNFTYNIHLSNLYYYTLIVRLFVMQTLIDNNYILKTAKRLDVATEYTSLQTYCKNEVIFIFNFCVTSVTQRPLIKKSI